MCNDRSSLVIRLGTHNFCVSYGELVSLLFNFFLIRTIPHRRRPPPPLPLLLRYNIIIIVVVVVLFVFNVVENRAHDDCIHTY